jgi:hypothetical protein
MMTPQMLPLPFDDGSDDAVPFVLTAAAHREVLGRDVPLVAVPAPAVTPTLSTTPSEPADDEVTDTRRVQARALLRSGMPVSTIAAALGADVAMVGRWTADLGDELARRRRRTARRVVRSSRSASPTVAPSLAPTAPAADPQARALLLPGLAFALTEADDESVTIAHDRIEPVAVLLDALRAVTELEESRVRVAVRLAPEVPADRVRAELAQRFGMDASAITIGRSGGRSGGRAAGRSGESAQRDIELRVDVRDAAAAAIVRAWIDGRVGVGGTGDAGISGLRGWDSNPQTFRLTADCSAS